MPDTRFSFCPASVLLLNHKHCSKWDQQHISSCFGLFYDNLDDLSMCFGVILVEVLLHIRFKNAMVVTSYITWVTFWKLSWNSYVGTGGLKCLHKFCQLIICTTVLLLLDQLLWSLTWYLFAGLISLIPTFYLESKYVVVLLWATICW